jgi:hypothetical protein
MDDPRRPVSWRQISKETLERSGRAARFITEYLPCLHYPWDSLREYSTTKAIRRDAKYLKNFFWHRQECVWHPAKTGVFEDSKASAHKVSKCDTVTRVK